jgi:endogenous inhibitor of DNA gyrase (YacG/DUF329 family)
MTCPICKAAVPENGKDRPFCSRRCQLIDLGNWLGERYAVPGEDATAEAAAQTTASDEEKRSPSAH